MSNKQKQKETSSKTQMPPYPSKFPRNCPNIPPIMSVESKSGYLLVNQKVFIHDWSLDFARLLMTKGKRRRDTRTREDLLAIGSIVLLLGAIAIYDGITRPLTLDTFGLKITEFVGGGFLTIIGAYLCAWGVSDKAGKDASKFLKAIWDRFLRALGK